MYRPIICIVIPFVPQIQRRRGEKRRHIMSQQDPGILSLPASSVTHWKSFLCFISWVVGCQFDLPCNIVFNSRNFRSRTRGPQNIVNNIVHLMLKQCVCRGKTWLGLGCTQSRMSRIDKQYLHVRTRTECRSCIRGWSSRQTWASSRHVCRAPCLQN